MNNPEIQPATKTRLSPAQRFMKTMMYGSVALPAAAGFYAVGVADQQHSLLSQANRQVHKLQAQDAIVPAQLTDDITRYKNKEAEAWDIAEGVTIFVATEVLGMFAFDLYRQRRAGHPESNG